MTLPKYRNSFGMVVENAFPKCPSLVGPFYELLGHQGSRLALDHNLSNHDLNP
jgi:hypothetical protein